MKKIVFLPLDERPCNYKYPMFLYKDSINLAIPDRSILGDKKKEANVSELIKFLYKECADADALTLSLDMLIYGGLLPSRIHYLKKEVLEERLSVLKRIKEINPNIKIYAFILIMRCPSYSSDDEEPTYYERCGREIHMLGNLTHKESLGMEVDKNEIKRLKEFIGEDDLNDFLNRRKGNLEIVKKVIEFRRDKIIDNLVIPQDDSAPYGYTAIDQATVREKIKECNLDTDILMYPGADEVGLALISKCYLRFLGKKPKVYIKYASDGAPLVIPPYEDRPLSETAKYHIMAAGGRIVSSYAEADIVLCFTNPSEVIKEANYQFKRMIEYDSFRNIPELIDFIKDTIDDRKPIIIADNAYVNGGDLSILKALNDNKLLDKIQGYAGWNTNANTLGTVLSQGFLYLVNGATKSHYDFLALRYIEDCGYCAKVRADVINFELEKLGFNYFYVKDDRGVVASIVKDRLNKFIKEYLTSIKDEIEIVDIYQPWRRMFETGITARWNRE